MVLEGYYPQSITSMSNKTERRIIVGITNPSLPPVSQEQIIEHIHDQVCYQFIPSLAKLYQDSPWLTVQNLMAHTKGKLLDVCLPYEHKNQRGEWIRHEARYFLLNSRVLGIRVKSGRAWKRYHCETLPIPPSISSHYKAGDNKQIGKQCLVGEFYLSLNKFKLAPLFETEVYTNPKIISEYEKYGCEVFSILDNKLRENMSERNLEIERHFLGNNNTLIYSGVKMSPNFSQVFWTNAVFKQGKETSKHLIPNPFKIGETMVQGINLEISRGTKTYMSFPEASNLCGETMDEDGVKPIKGLDCSMEKMEGGNPSINKTFAQFRVPIRIQLLYIWYIYNHINKCRPFIVEVPCRRRALSLVYLLNELKENLKKFNIALNNELLIGFKEDQRVKTSKFWPSEFTVCSEVIQKEELERRVRKGNEAHLYLEGEEEIRYWVEKSKKYPSIFQSSCILSERFEQIKIESKYLASNDGDDEESTVPGRRLQKLCDEIIQKKFNSIPEMIEYFLEKEKDIHKLKQAFSFILPLKLKSKLMLHPPYISLITMSQQAVEFILSEVQTNMTIQRDGKENVNQQSLERKVTVDMKAREAKGWKQKNKILFVTCHSCEEVIRKQLSVSCKTCRKHFCFECLAKNSSTINDDFDDFMQNLESKCAYCQKYCRCTFCMEVKRNAERRNREDRERYLERMKEGVDESATKVSSISKSCIICNMADRTGKRKEVYIECSKCERQFCWECERLNPNFPKSCNQEWICKKCLQSMQPEQDLKISVEDQQRQMLLTLNFEETPAGIKKREEDEERKRNLALFLMQNRETGNEKSIEREMDSPSRSREKGYSRGSSNPRDQHRNNGRDENDSQHYKRRESKDINSRDRYHQQRKNRDNVNTEHDNQRENNFKPRKFNQDSDNKREINKKPRKFNQDRDNDFRNDSGEGRVQWGNDRGRGRGRDRDRGGFFNGQDRQFTSRGDRKEEKGSTLWNSEKEEFSKSKEEKRKEQDSGLYFQQEKKACDYEEFDY